MARADGCAKGVADIENNIAREYTKLGAVIQVPFRTGNQFLGEGGIQVLLSFPFCILLYSSRGHSGHLLRNKRPVSFDRRPACESGQNTREFHRTTLAEAENGDKSSYKGLPHTTAGEGIDIDKFRHRIFRMTPGSSPLMLRENVNCLPSSWQNWLGT